MPRKLKGQTKVRSRVKKKRTPDPDTEAIVAKVHKLMKQKEISLAELAFRAKLHPMTLYQYLEPFRNGFGSLRISIIRALANGCQVPVRQLLEVIRP